MLSTPHRPDAATRAVPADLPRDGARSRAGCVPAGRRGRLIAASALGGALLMMLHAQIPNEVGQLGSLFQTFLPWAGLSVPVLLTLAAVRRSRLAAVAVVAPAVVWVSLFGGAVVDKSSAGGDLIVLTHNVDEANREPGRTARALARSGAHVLALEELSAKATPVYERELAASHPYHSVHLGIGLWSTYPLHRVEPVPIMPWTRAVRATVDTPKGPVAVFAAHLASVRVTPTTGFATARRNEAGRNLAEAVAAEQLPRVVVMGDFNGTSEDTALKPLTSQLRSAQREAGAGFGFTWPASTRPPARSSPRRGHRHRHPDRRTGPRARLSRHAPRGRTTALPHGNLRTGTRPRPRTHHRTGAGRCPRGPTDLRQRSRRRRDRHPRPAPGPA